jgi:CheY-like chemotaxis protein
MEKRLNIVVLGNSLILGALGESLRRGGQFNLTSLSLPEGIKDLEPMKPDAILFDLETPHMDAVFSLSECCAKLLLVGVSPDTNIVRMWVGRQMKELSTQGLLTVIKEQLSMTMSEGGSA